MNRFVFVFLQTDDNKLNTFIDNVKPCVTYKISISAVQTERQYAFYSEVYRINPKGKEYVYLLPISFLSMKNLFSTKCEATSIRYWISVCEIYIKQLKIKFFLFLHQIQYLCLFAVSMKNLW